MSSLTKIKGKQIALGSGLGEASSGKVKVVSDSTTGGQQLAVSVGSNGVSLNAGLLESANIKIHTDGTAYLDAKNLTGATIAADDQLVFYDVGQTGSEEDSLRQTTLEDFASALAGSGLSASGGQLSTSGSDHTFYGVTNNSGAVNDVVADGTYGTGGIDSYGAGVGNMSGNATSDVSFFVRRISQTNSPYSSLDCYFYKANSSSITEEAIPYRPSNHYIEVFLNGVKQDVIIGNDTGVALVQKEASVDNAAQFNRTINEAVISMLVNNRADCGLLLDSKTSSTYVVFATSDIESGDLISIID